MGRRYFRFRNLLPDLSESQHRRLNKANQFLNPLVNFQSVGNKTLGIIKEEETKTNNVIDITEGNHTIIAKIDSEGMISWRNFDLTENQIDWEELDKTKLKDDALEKTFSDVKDDEFEYELEEIIKELEDYIDDKEEEEDVVDFLKNIDFDCVCK